MAKVTQMLLLFLLLGGSALANESNERMKECLNLYGYTPDQFDTFDFQAAAACHQGHRTIELLAERERIKEFLEEKPHFRGTNWKWEERAEYTCKHINTLQGSAVVCQKPYYIN